jgi:hypothetical protein
LADIIKNLDVDEFVAVVLGYTMLLAYIIGTCLSFCMYRATTRG